MLMKLQEMWSKFDNNVDAIEEKIDELQARIAHLESLKERDEAKMQALGVVIKMIEEEKK